MGLLRLCSLLTVATLASTFRVPRTRDGLTDTGSLVSDGDADDQLSSAGRRRRRDRRRTRSRGTPRRRDGGGGGGGSDGTSDRVITKQSPSGAEVAWVAQGNLVDKKKDEVKVSTDAGPDDYEVMYLGVSTGDKRKDTPQDGDRMEDQGFKLIGVKGDSDKKVELWIRKNEGRGAISVCKKCGLWGKGAGKGGMGCGWGVMSLKGVSLDLGSIRIKTDSRSHSSTLSISKIKEVSSRKGLNILAVFFDDSVEIQGSDNGDVAINKWGFGDGDGTGMIVWQPGKSVPSKISVKAHDSGGRQAVSVFANIELK